MPPPVQETRRTERKPPPVASRRIPQLTARTAVGSPTLLADPVRVVVAADSWHYARALEAMLQLEGDIEVLGIASSAAELRELAAANDVDVVLLDVDLPGMEGIAGCSSLRADHPDVAVVVVTATPDRELARRCMAVGARACIVKRDSRDPERLAEAARHVARGEPFFDHVAQELLLDLASRAPDPAREAGLTPRELEVLPLVAEGLQNRELASRLGVSEQTVRNHLSNIYRKLGARNRTEMAAEARRRGILA